MKILCFAEQRGGKLKNSAFEALTLAHQLSGGKAADIAALVIGDNASSIASQLAGFGADTVYCAEHASLQHYNCLTYAQALQNAIEKFKPDLIIGAATPMGKDLLPRISARLNAPLVTDIIHVESAGGELQVKKPMYAGKVVAQLKIQKAELQILSIRPNVFAVNKANTGAGKIDKLDFVPTANAAFVTKDIRKGQSERPDLTEAGIIISGGRAMGNADNFKILFECADVIGASVGASRAAVDSGYATHDMQVGQTGKTVNPNLYIACGISGSIQHMAGMRTAKVIVAINTDPEAPIFTIANYGIVGDLFRVVPILTKKLKELGH